MYQGVKKNQTKREKYQVKGLQLYQVLTVIYEIISHIYMYIYMEYTYIYKLLCKFLMLWNEADSVV